MTCQAIEKCYPVTPAELERFRAMIQREKGCTLTGDLVSGTLSFSSPVGLIQIAYRYDGRKLLTVGIERMPPFITTGWVFNEIGLHIQQAAAERV